MTDIEALNRLVKQKISTKIELINEGVDRYRIFTPFTFSDGDHYVLILRRLTDDRWLISDEGHTYMHLSYQIDESDLRQGTRQTIIANALSMFNIDEHEGVLQIPHTPENFADALFSFIQGIAHITDVSYLTRERVQSTFLEDFRQFFTTKVPESRRKFNWYEPRLDPQGNYKADLRINGRAIPVLVFAIPNDTKARDVTITLHQYERWKLQYESIAVFENQEEINRQVLARLTDVLGKQFSSLEGNQDRIGSFVDLILATG